MRKFPERLKELLTSLDVTQEAFAKKIGCAKGSISYYVRGIRSPQSSVLFRIAVVYGVSINWLLGVGEKK